MDHLAANSQSDSDFESQKPGLWRRFKNRLGLPGKNKPRRTFREKLRQLTVSQWFYLAAFIVLLSTIGESRQPNGNVINYAVIILAGIGLIREMWHLFHTIWEKTLGKGLLLVLYAGTANLALAIAALKINHIAGVEPTPFIFTLGFTTFLTLPFWLVTATVVFFSVALVAGNLWLLICLLLRLVGIKVPIHWEDKSFVVAFMILRIIMIPALIIGLVHLVEPYAKQMDVFGDGLVLMTGPSSDVDKQNLEDMSRRELTTLLEQLTGPQRARVQARLDAAGLMEGQTEPAEAQEAVVPAVDAERPDGAAQADAAPVEEVRFIDMMVARFIYHFETYPHSACAKRPEQHALTIDDYSMFVAEKDDSPLGYRFSVEPCVPRYTKEPSESGQ
ncbi:hypothetical protein [Bowmanella dokdonensis]|uniref:Uncharacterized protein n=1 Tax=Bowmanella dokdonensis TaxID=751969 RepID=A0A939DQZ4_9ALTE|nr:hypothetical protein [Bowmanella dokdonensis]MBN7827358.1 hypothetical protein [Bowmanella dokdonensis]